jgi:hypothetical protein
MALTTIATGLSGLRAAAEMTKMLRDGLRAGQVRPDDIAGKIGEIYDYIIDSKAALVDAQEEHQRLRDQIRSLQLKDDVTNSLAFDGKVYWKKDDPEFPFCAVCWDKDKNLVRLQLWGSDIYGGIPKTDYRCLIHSHSFFVRNDRKRE